MLAEFEHPKSLQEICQSLGQQLQPLNLPELELASTTSIISSEISSTDGAVESALQPLSGRSLSEVDMGEAIAPNEILWTTLTTDRDYIVHLLSLYFCWEYPIFASLSKARFLEDFRSGQRRYCSSLLLTIILAVGRQFSTQASQDGNVKSSADEFASEAERLLSLENGRPSLTTIQALGIMSIFQASRGRSDQGVFYSGQAIRMAIEMGLHLNMEIAHLSNAEQEVRRATVWGVHTLDL